MSTTEEKPRNKLWSIISNLIYLIIVTVLVVNVYNTYARSNGKDLILEDVIPSYWIAVVVSGSMLPVLQINGSCICEDVNIEEVEVDDIIVYNNNGRLIIHRVYEKVNDANGKLMVHTKGDNNEIADTFDIYDEHIEGRVVSIWNWTKPFIDWYTGVNPSTSGSSALKGVLITFMSALGMMSLIVSSIRNKMK